MLSIIGIVMLVSIVALMMSRYFSPFVVLCTIPIVAALVAGFDLSQITEYYKAGVAKVFEIAIMFIFAIIFFGIMNDIGLFNPLISKVLKLTKSNRIAITCGTVLIAAVVHLDGSGAATFLITIPALLPLYRRLNMNPYLLLTLIAISASIVNLIPWAGPTGRAAIVLGMQPTDVWKPLIPIQLIGIFFMVVIAYIFGLREQRRAALNPPLHEAYASETGITAKSIIPNINGMKAPLWINFTLTVIVISSLFFDVVPSSLVFMIGTSIALILNYPAKKMQLDVLQKHAPASLLMAIIIVSAGVLLGVLNGTGMLEAMSHDLLTILPDSAIPHLHLIIGFLGLPLELILSTDATYFALFPVILEVTTQYGVDPLTAMHVMMVGNIVGTFISPLSPALWLALGLTGLDLGKYLKYAFFYTWAFSIILIAMLYIFNIV
ncbi:citrate:proton symporter [Sphingobacterium sp. lm-10]|uniref:CitMHS family transporter n=1 Tax=Sphingobacterium sp. lm-10 TaxID=2944904 RepID=UPI002022627D|nr:citrate:proton symporter [Sphingobacterium sp. lm-10]MCL7987252.1 citrate:proton symporter [Sphingobacterium sp. lm-10]